MIPRTVPTCQIERWQDALNNLIRTPSELIHALNLDPALLADAQASSMAFKLKVPHAFVARMEKGNINDPLLRQVLPLGAELTATPGYCHDPLNEQASNPHPGLIHKYHGRVLLIVTGSCAIHCRYCFRRHFPYEDNRPNRESWQDALQYIQADASITEVIYSGGDPMTAPDKLLAWLTTEIAKIPHVQRLRIHTRLPIVIPQRITTECLDWMGGSRLQTSMVIHSNHANELDESVAKALCKLREAGITLLNQTVLLKGINDSNHSLITLSERLFSYGVLPYYLHLLDKVTGAAHFFVSREQAIALHTHLQHALPGYLVPKLVQEAPNAPSKTPVF